MKLRMDGASGLVQSLGSLVGLVLVGVAVAGANGCSPLPCGNRANSLCADEPSVPNAANGTDGGAVTPSPRATGGSNAEPDPGTPGGPGASTLRRGIGSGRPGYQTKSTEQLGLSLDACIGPSARKVTASMIRAAGNDVGFLPAASTHGIGFLIGDDVVFGQELSFDGDMRTLQTGVRADALTLTYMSALLNVANAAGRYCKENAVDPNCDCSTADAAQAMLTRCLPSFAPDTPGYADAAAALTAKCAIDPPAAVASLLASSAFGKQ